MRTVHPLVSGLLVSLALLHVGATVHHDKEQYTATSQEHLGCSVTSISSGGWHNCAISPQINGSHLKCWGQNQGGQLGLGDNRNRGNNTGQMADNLPAVNLGTGFEVVQVSAGNMHTCAVSSKGQVKCWGNNVAGQLGLNDTKTRGNEPGEMGNALPVVELGTNQVAVAVGAGLNHTCALLRGGKVKCWGDHTYGQLAIGIARIEYPSLGSHAGDMGDNLQFIELGTGRKAVQLAVGAWHTCVLLDKGDVKCWGRNNFGQLGYGNTINNGEADGEMGDHLPTVNLGTGVKATSIAAGGEHTCAVIDSAVKCWGHGAWGELGYGDTSNRGDQPGEMGDALPAVDLGLGVTVKQVATGGLHTCAVLSKPEGKVKCWGWNPYGQLGLGDTYNRGDGGKNGSMGDALPFVYLGRKAVQVTAGGYTEGVYWYGHSCALLDDGGVKCWGINAEHGILGYGRNTFQIGSQPGDMTRLPEVPVCGSHPYPIPPSPTIPRCPSYSPAPAGYGH